MNDNQAAFKQQLQKLSDGGELGLEFNGLNIRIVQEHGIFIVVVETLVSLERFYEFIQLQTLNDNEQYLFHGNKVLYCLFLKNIDLSGVIYRTNSIIECSKAYQ